MSIIIANDGDYTVSTIVVRNAITKRHDGMRVIVRDATGDPTYGGGMVEYIWEAAGSKWVGLSTSKAIFGDVSNNDIPYVRKNGQWVELEENNIFDVYALKTSTSPSGTLVIDAAIQQIYTLTTTAARSISFTDGPTGRAVTSVLVLKGTKAPTFTGTNIKWTDGVALDDTMMSPVKTILTALWDGEEWIINRGGGY